MRKNEVKDKACVIVRDAKRNPENWMSGFRNSVLHLGKWNFNYYFFTQEITEKLTNVR